jgi:hypothetical protein
MFVSSELEQLRLQSAVYAYEEPNHRVSRSPSALGRTAGVEDPDAGVVGDLGQVRVAVDDGGAAAEPGSEACRSPGPQTSVMDQPQSRLPHLDDALSRQHRSERGLVHIPVHGRDRTEPPELLEHALGHEVACVNDQVGIRQLTPAGFREPPPAARQVRVGEDGDSRG